MGLSVNYIGKPYDLVQSGILMVPEVSNTETDAELKSRAMSYINREICKIYKKTGETTFTEYQIRDNLRGLHEDYINKNLRDLLSGSDLVEIDDKFQLKLTEEGKRRCNEG